MNRTTPPNPLERTRDHLANERTFLAWIRTSLATLGFGFVLARMGLFLHELPGLVRPAGEHVPDRREAGGEFMITGVVFLGIGTFLAAWAAWHYERGRRQLDRDVFTPARVSPSLLAAFIFVSGLVIIAMVVTRGWLPAPMAGPPAAIAP